MASQIFTVVTIGGRSAEVARKLFIAWKATLGKAHRHQQSPEDSWLLCRLQEACAAWEPLAETALIVVIREVFSGSTLDQEVVAALALVPDWLGQGFESAVV